MKHCADVIVVGGGIMGASISYYLTKQGIKPTLLERGILAEGTCGSSGGSLSLVDKSPGILMMLAQKSVNLYHNLEQELDYNFGYQRCGTLVPVEDEESFTAVRKWIEPLRQNGLECITYSREELRHKEPFMSDHVIGGFLFPQEAIVDPVRVALGLAWKARCLGATILTDCKVININWQPGSSDFLVSTSKGDYTAPLLINAAGVWSPEIASFLDRTIPVIPRQGQLAIMEPGINLLQTLILGASYFRVKYDNSQYNNKSESISMAIEQRGPYVIVGSSRRFVGMDRTPDDSLIAYLIDQATRFLPALADRKCVSKIACVRPYTPDHLPILGGYVDFPSFIQATGHEGDGICLAPITGKLIAEIVATGKTTIDISALSPSRFKEKEWEK